MYGAFIRTGDPGPEWPAFSQKEGSIMWLGEEVEAKPHLLDAEWNAFAAEGLEDVEQLEKILAKNTRASLNSRKRAFVFYDLQKSA